MIHQRDFWKWILHDLAGNRGKPMKGYAMSVQVGDTWFRVKDRVSWQLLGMEGECLEMHGELTAIRVTSPVIGVAKDSNDQKWLLDLAEVKNNTPFRGIQEKEVNLPRGPFDLMLTQASGPESMYLHPEWVDETEYETKAWEQGG